MPHAEDMGNAMNRGETNVGRSAMNFKEILSHAEKVGAKHFFVAIDESSAPWEDMRAGLEYLQELRF
jgi:hypothetical protein